MGNRKERDQAIHLAQKFERDQKIRTESVLFRKLAKVFPEIKFSGLMASYVSEAGTRLDVTYRDEERRDEYTIRMARVFTRKELSPLGIKWKASGKLCIVRAIIDADRSTLRPIGADSDPCWEWLYCNCRKTLCQFRPITKCWVYRQFDTVLSTMIEGGEVLKVW